LDANHASAINSIATSTADNNFGGNSLLLLLLLLLWLDLILGGDHHCSLEESTAPNGAFTSV
jgi:hypothetical protein